MFKFLCCCDTQNDEWGEQRSLVNNRYGSVTNSNHEFPTRRSQQTSRENSRDPTSDLNDKSLEVLGCNKVVSLLSPLEMKQTSVPTVDKRFLDHSLLYNKYLSDWDELNNTLSRLCNSYDASLSDSQNESTDPRAFPASKNDDVTRRKSFKRAFRRIKELTKTSTSVRLSHPHKFCVEIVYEGRDVRPEVIPAFLAFNAAGRLVRILLDKAPALRSSLEYVVNSANELRRDILVSSSGSRGPESLKNCAYNVEQLRTAAKRIGEIEQQTEDILADLRNCRI